MEWEKIINGNTKMQEVTELSGKEFKAAIIKTLHE